MAMPSTLADLATRPTVTMVWNARYGTYGSNVWASNGGAYASGSIFLPFASDTPSTGDSPTSYVYGEQTVKATPAESCIVGTFVNGAREMHRAVFYDLLWIGPIISGTTASQTIGSGALPARDSLGAANGEDCMLVAWNSGGNPTISASYTNSAGTSGRTASIATTTNGGPWVLSLQAGDTGVRSVQSMQTTTTNAVRLGIVRRLAVAQRPENGTLFQSATASTRPTSRLHNLGSVPAGALIFPLVSQQGNSSAVDRNITLELAML